MAIILKRGLEANRASTAVAEGEMLFSRDTGRLYIGSGSSNLGGQEINFNNLTASAIIVQNSESISRITLLSHGTVANADSIFVGRVASGTPISASSTLQGHYTAWQMQTWGTSSWSTTARMMMQAAENHNDASRPTNIIFATVASGSSTLGDRFKINGVGVQVTGSLGVTTDITVGGSVTVVNVTASNAVLVGGNTATAYGTTGKLQVWGTSRNVAPAEGTSGVYARLSTFSPLNFRHIHKDYMANTSNSVTERWVKEINGAESTIMQLTDGDLSVTGSITVGTTLDISPSSATLNLGVGSAAGTRQIVFGSTYNAGSISILNGLTTIASIAATGILSNVGFRAGVGSGPTAVDFGWSGASGFYSPTANNISVANNNARVANFSTTALTLDYTTNSTTPTAGALVVGNGTAATSVGIGGGNVNAGGTITTNTGIFNANTTATSISPANDLMQGLSVRGGYNYTLNGTVNGRQMFSGETMGGAFGYSSIIAFAGSAGAILKKPIASNYGTNAIVGFAYDDAGGGRTPVAVYGYAVQNAGALTNSSNRPVGGLFVAEISSSGVDFKGTAYGVYGKADSTAAVSSTGSIVGVYGESIGKNTDTTYGGRFTATGGSTNYGISVDAGIVRIADTTVATTSTVGAFVVGTGTAATSVAIGGGKIFVGSDINVGGNIVAVGNITASALYVDAAVFNALTMSVDTLTVNVMMNGTASYAITSATASFVLTSSYAITSATSSITTTASFARTASYVVTALTASVAGTASYVLYSSIAGSPALVSSSAQFTASDIFTIGQMTVTQLTASNLYVDTANFNTLTMSADIVIVSGSVSASVVRDTYGNVRSIPQNWEPAAYTMSLIDVGQHVYTTSSVLIPTSVFSTGDVSMVVNSGSGDVSIVTGSGVTFRLAGSAATGNRTLSNYGSATVMCVAPNLFYLSGAGLT